MGIGGHDKGALTPNLQREQAVLYFNYVEGIRNKG